MGLLYKKGVSVDNSGDILFRLYERREKNYGLQKKAGCHLKDKCCFYLKALGFYTLYFLPNQKKKGGM